VKSALTMKTGTKFKTVEGKTFEFLGVILSPFGTEPKLLTAEKGMEQFFVFASAVKETL